MLTLSNNKTRLIAGGFFSGLFVQYLVFEIFFVVIYVLYKESTDVFLAI